MPPLKGKREESEDEFTPTVFQSPPPPPFLRVEYVYFNIQWRTLFFYLLLTILFTVNRDTKIYGSRFVKKDLDFRILAKYSQR